MALLNHVTRELTAKIVYYGPGLCGKTSNLKFIYENTDDEQRTKMLSLSTEADRTLFFDFLPMDLGTMRGFKVRVQLYTVPGQVFYEETRKRVLKGCDGVVFVADSQRRMAEANRESLLQLHQHLKDNHLLFSEIALVLQYNKRDLGDLLSVEELDRDLNPGNVPFFEAVASEGIGVEDTLKAIIRLVMANIMKKGLGRTRDEEPRVETRTTAATPTRGTAAPSPAPASDPTPLPEPLPAPLFEEAVPELILAADADPFAEETGFAETQEIPLQPVWLAAPPAPSPPAVQDPEWLFEETGGVAGEGSGAEAISLLGGAAPLEEILTPSEPLAAFDPPPEEGYAEELFSPAMSAQSEGPLSSETPISASRPTVESTLDDTDPALPLVRIKPGQHFQAEIEIGGRMYRLRVELDLVP
jgi:mutual gliding-motility protein MglA